MLASLQVAIPDVYIGEDGVIRILFTIEAAQLENLSLANQILLEDMFIQTASFMALRLHGRQYGLALQEGTAAVGQLRFTGVGGTFIPIGTDALYDPGQALPAKFFVTTEEGTIDNPGTPLAPSVAVGSSPGITGDYEYAVTFVTASGETLQGPDSDLVSVSNQAVNLSNISIGGPGTLSRRIYRQKFGDGNYYRVATITDNSTTVLVGENMSDATAATQPTAPILDSAHSITLNAVAAVPGTDGNVSAGTITALSGAPGALTEVVNDSAFTGGSDTEDIESYRQKLLARVRNAQTGSAGDLKSWAEAVQGVESATVFENDNLGVTTPGHVTVRIAGPNGGIPSSSVQDSVLAELEEKDMANITIHVGTFTPVPTNVTVHVALDTQYTLGDVTPGAQAAIISYINSLPVGGTLYVSGIVDAVFGLAGIADVTVSTPATNLTTAVTEKRIAGTITISSP